MTTASVPAANAPTPSTSRIATLGPRTPAMRVIVTVGSETGLSPQITTHVVADLDLIRTFGPASGLCAVLVLCMYINEQQNLHEHYSHPEVLWVICPILLYWIMRLWLRAQRLQLSEDPLVFALRDRISYIAAVLMGVAMLLATVIH